MSQGGARIRSGPVPDPNALRRDRPNDAAGWAHLPAAGRSEPAPAWPLSRSTARERLLWTREWARPQALMWEANGQATEVAIYVRSLKDAERPRASVASRTLVRQQMDALGLTIPGLRSHRWIIDAEDQPEQQVTRTDDSDRASAKARFKALEGGVAS
jgi:hypothetical protein